MKLAYLLEDTSISSITATAVAQADALIARGHRVRIVTEGSPLTWRSSRAEWIYVDHFQEYNAGEDDFVIGRNGISIPIETGRIVDDEFFRARIPPEHQPLRVLLAGTSQSESKGIDDGYGAAAHARWFHQKFDLIRVAAFAPSREEPLDAVQEFHVALDRSEMTRLMHSCDVLIAPHHRDEQFALTTAEALASGVAIVMTSIPLHLSFDEKRDYALFAPEENAIELGEKLIELLSDAEVRQSVRQRGREIAQQWRADRVAERIEKFFQEHRMSL